MSRILDFTKKTLGRNQTAGTPTDTELAVISYIIDRSKRGDVTHKDIASWFSLRTAQAEELLQKMESDGLVTLAQTGSKHKQLAVSLTGKALDIYERALSRIWRLENDAPRERSRAADLSLAGLLNPPEPTEGSTV